MPPKKVKVLENNEIFQKWFNIVKNDDDHNKKMVQVINQSGNK